LLDRTNFYAEQGGQSFDTGFLTDPTGDTDFSVSDVQLKGGMYVLHVGTLRAGTIKVGDTVKVSIDSLRRRPIMSNHTGTHVLNYALRQVLGEADQMGSAVDADRLRFDFTCKKAMTSDQIAEAEAIVRNVIAKGQPVHAKLASLADAKAVAGLRHMFDENYPDPVRVVSVGVTSDELLADPNGRHAFETSVEFCGGTYGPTSSFALFLCHWL